MRTQNQFFMITLAVVFAVALSLTVAMIFLNSSAAGSPPKDSSPPILPDGSGSLPPKYTNSVSTAAPLDSQKPETDLPVPMNSLEYHSFSNGTCRVDGIGTLKDAFVVIPDYAPNGDRVVEIADRAFMGCQSVTAIQIPSGVTAIGHLAFANCQNLIYISVSKGNLQYCDIDGVLYSKDRRVLILYPPMHAGESVFLSSEVIQISEMAFYRCAYLTSVRYGGSPELWEQIRIGSKNYSLTAAAIIFSSRS